MVGYSSGVRFREKVRVRDFPLYRKTQSGFGVNSTHKEPLGRNFHSGFGVNSAQGMAYTQRCGESGDIVSTALNNIIANMM